MLQLSHSCRRAARVAKAKQRSPCSAVAPFHQPHGSIPCGRYSGVLGCILAHAGKKSLQGTWKCGGRPQRPGNVILLAAGRAFQLELGAKNAGHRPPGGTSQRRHSSRSDATPCNGWALGPGGRGTDAAGCHGGPETKGMHSLGGSRRKVSQSMCWARSLPPAAPCTHMEVDDAGLRVEGVVWLGIEHLGCREKHMRVQCVVGEGAAAGCLW